MKQQQQHKTFAGILHNFYANEACIMILFVCCFTSNFTSKLGNFIDHSIPEQAAIIRF